MRRQCARPSCSAVATATFTFDSAECTVWLDAPHEGNARAGDLCARHARALNPPRGWTVVDRREATSAPGRPAASNALVDVASPPAKVATPTIVPQSPVAAAPAERTGWYPKFDRADTLNGVLDASTPLLSRAFDNVRAV
jgi:hypothetical protein